MSSTSEALASSSTATDAPPNQAGRGNRGGGKGYWKRGKGRGRGQNTVAPPPKELASGVPKPKALSTTSSELKNDPALVDTYAMDNGPTYVPARSVPRIHISCAGFPSLTTFIYTCLSAANRNFARRISLSAFVYYANCHLMARIIAIRVKQGNADQTEARFLDFMRTGQFTLPAPLDPYFRSIGEFIIDGSTRFQVDLPNYHTNNWGRVAPNSVARWVSFPLNYVLVQRIQNDIAITLNPNHQPNWNLANNLRPIAVVPPAGGAAIPAGTPTANLAGYMPATPLTPDQMTLFTSSGITDQEFDSEFPNSFRVNRTLLLTISQTLGSCSDDFVLAPSPHEEILGSVSQACFAEIHPSPDQAFNRKRHFINTGMINATGSKIQDPRLACATILYCLRWRFDQPPGLANYLPYDFGQYGHDLPTYREPLQRYLLSVDAQGNAAPVVQQLNIKSYVTNQYDRSDIMTRVVQKAVKKQGLY